MRKRTSTFARFRAMNPRYEKIHFCLKVKLILGKDENYYKERLKDDVRKFIAPWAVGEFYDQKYTQIDIDISALAGQKVKFILDVALILCAV